ncbi:hypothetical protein [Faecalibacillus intestinalis]|uniref:hypothetical protein n=1 Tax=Faecalibacillus intestinalis TaxID=1982626 RepID=UPI0039953576
MFSFNNCFDDLSRRNGITYHVDVLYVFFTIFGSVESVNDSAHVLGVIDSAMDKLEAIEQANYIDKMVKK